MSKITLFEDDNFAGRFLPLTGSDSDLRNSGFNDTTSSLIVESGTWTLFEDINFQGNSITVDAHGGPGSDGRYPNPAWLAGRNDAYSSVRMNA